MDTCSIDNKITKIYSSIPSEIKACFFASIICGVFAHIYVMTNHLYNYDEIGWTPSGYGGGAEWGRWGLDISGWAITKLFGNVYTIPVINGMITILMTSIVACIVVDLFEIKEKTYAALVGGLMITFPALVCRMFFMFTTHLFSIGMFLSAIGCLIFIKKKHSILYICLAVIFAAFGMGIYQANFVTAVCICVGYLLHRYLKEDYDLKTVLLECFQIVLFLIMVVIAYFAISKLYLDISGKHLTDNEGLNTMGKITVSQLLLAIGRCYSRFLKLGISDIYGLNPRIIVRCSFCFCFFVFIYTCFKVLISKKSGFMKTIIVLIFAIIPLSINLIVVMAVSSGIMYSIMLYENVYVFIFSIVCLQSFGDGRYDTFINYISAMLMSFVVLTYIWFSNGNYLALEYTNTHDIAYFTSLMTHIKQADGYKDDMPVILIGEPGDDKSFMGTSLIGNTFNLGGKAETNIGAYSYWEMMERIVGFGPEVTMINDENSEFFTKYPETIDMPIYPDSGSISVIDDSVVVKFK